MTFVLHRQTSGFMLNAWFPVLNTIPLGSYGNARMLHADFGLAEQSPTACERRESRGRRDIGWYASGGWYMAGAWDRRGECSSMSLFEVCQLNYHSMSPVVDQKRALSVEQALKCILCLAHLS